MPGGVEDGVDNSGVSKEKLRGCVQVQEPSRSLRSSPFLSLGGDWGETGYVRVAFDALDVCWGEMGHVRVAFGALDVECFSARSNCWRHRCYACVELGIGMRLHRWKWH